MMYDEQGPKTKKKKKKMSKTTKDKGWVFE